MVLRVVEGDRCLCSQKEACLLGIKGVGLLWDEEKEFWRK